MDILLQQLVDFSEKEDLFSNQDRVLLAVSGGKDSMLMLDLFYRLGMNVAVAHCNFQLRGEDSNRDEAFVRAVAEEKGIRFFVKQFDTISYAQQHKLSIQEAARKLRYTWFESLTEQYHYTRIAIAQHQTDVVETMLYNLIRGTGIAGLHGILGRKNKIIRPLLFLQRGDVDNYVYKWNLAYREDVSNASDKYVRNFLRLQVVPLLRKLNPSLEKSVMYTSHYLRETELVLQQRVEQERQKLFIIQDGRIKFLWSLLQTLSPKELLVYELLKPFGFTSGQIALLCSKSAFGNGAQFNSLTHTLLYDRGYFYVEPIQKNINAKEVIFNEHQSEAIFLNHIIHKREVLGCRILNTTEDIISIDAQKITYPLTIRNWVQGDSFSPLGMRGHKKLSDYFINKKVPLNKKGTIPLLLNADGRIIWVVGFQIGEGFKVDEMTEKIVIFERKKDTPL